MGSGRPTEIVGLNRFSPYVSHELQIDSNPGPDGYSGIWVSSGTSFNGARAFAIRVNPDNASDHAGFTSFSGMNRSTGFLFKPDTAGGTIDFQMGPYLGPYTNALHIASSGNVGINTTSPTQALEINGNLQLTIGSGGHVVFPDGTQQSTAWTGLLPGGDYSEAVDVTGARNTYEPGDLLIIDAEHPGRFLKSSQPYSTLVGGVYATRPGVTGRRQPRDKGPDGEIPMAMVGIVPTKVSSENGPIQVGDLLVSSSRTGYAMKGTDRALMVGATVGKALAPLLGGDGTIEVLISLQ